jgi:hypothetical protein
MTVCEFAESIFGTGMTENGFMVEVFSTNVQGEATARQLVEKMLVSFPNFSINFDLDDCDRILRVKGKAINTGEIIAIVESEGYQCRLMG